MKPIHASLSLCLSLLLAAPAQAFTLLSPSITKGWAGPELTFRINIASCTSLGITEALVRDSVASAVDLWNSTPTSSLKLKVGADTTATAAAAEPTIYCAVDVSDPDTNAAQGGVGTVSGEGRPTTGVVKLNGLASSLGYFGGTTQVYANIILAHEMGHALGLGHSDFEGSLMHWTIAQKNEFRLSQDDIDAISWLNPRSEPGDGMLGCGRIETRGKDGGSGPLSGSGAPTLVFMLGLMTLGWLELKRRAQAARA